MRFFIYFLSILSLLISRDNPFKNRYDIENKFIKPSEIGFIKKEIYLPATAIEIRKITIEYKNLDSSIDKKVIRLSSPLDRTKPIIVYQTETKSLEQNMISLKSNRHKAVLKPYKFLKFEIDNNKIKIITNQKLIRNFPIPRPQVILMDFKYKSILKPKKLNLDKISYFKSIDITLHNGYFRVSVEVDNIYRYKIFTKEYGYLLVIEV